MEKVRAFHKRSSKQFCKIFYHGLSECRVENRKMTFSPEGCARCLASPVKREEDHDSAASFLSFQKLAMQQTNQVRRSTGGRRTWVQTSPPCQPTWEQRAGQPDMDFGQHPLSSSASSSLEQHRSRERRVLSKCLWLRCLHGRCHACATFGKGLPFSGPSILWQRQAGK